MNRREEMKRAIEQHKAVSPPKAAKKVILKVAAAATKKVRNNPRSAKARDARAKARGRLPTGTTISTEFNGKDWDGELCVFDTDGRLMHSIIHRAEGHFRLSEELDVHFWNWFSQQPPIIKAQMAFSTESPKPEPYPKESK